MTQTILLTGSAGHVLSNFVREALKQKTGYNFCSIDLCTEPNSLNNVYANKGHNIYLGDINNKHFLDLVFQIEKPDIIIHGAEDKSSLQTNIIGTQNLLELAAKYKTKRFVYLSTDKVYSNDISSTEETVPAPASLYTVSKYSAELLVKASNLNYNILRLSNSYGPRQQIDKFIPTIINNVLQNTKTQIHSKGQQVRDWTYVTDIYMAIIAVLEKGQSNTIYNVSANYELSNLELYQAVCNIIGKGHELLTFVDGDEGHDLKRVIDSSKLKSIGWKPIFKFKKSLELTTSWYTNNQWWFRKFQENK